MGDRTGAGTEAVSCVYAAFRPAVTVEPLRSSALHCVSAEARRVEAEPFPPRIAEGAEPPKAALTYTGAAGGAAVSELPGAKELCPRGQGLAWGPPTAEPSWPQMRAVRHRLVLSKVRILWLVVALAEVVSGQLKPLTPAVLLLVVAI